MCIVVTNTCRPSLLNHSCLPNCVAVFSGSELAVRTITPVQQGDQVHMVVSAFICSLISTARNTAVGELCGSTGYPGPEKQDSAEVLLLPVSVSAMPHRD